MPRVFRLFGQDIVMGKRLFGIGREDNYYGMVNLLGNDNKSFNRLNAYKGLVYACIRRVADTYASYEPYVEKKLGNEWHKMEAHPILNLLNNPGGYNDQGMPINLFDVLYATASFIELQGGCYWYLPKGSITRQPREIIVLRFDKVGMSLNDQGEVIGYYVRTNGGGDRIPLDLEEVIPFIGFDPKDPYRGVGSVEAGSTYIETDEYSSNFTKNFFKNNAGISGVLNVGSKESPIDRVAFRKMVALWRKRYQGVDNAGKVMMVRGSDATKFEKVGLGLDELDMSALRKMSVEDICVMIGVPKALLGLSDETGLGRGNVETYEYLFSKYTIEPKMRRLDAILNFAMKRYFGGDDAIRVRHANIIPEDKEYELKKREQGVDKYITRNEVRAEDGKPDIDGGDQLFVPAVNLPLEDAGATQASSSSSASYKGDKKRVYEPITLRISRDSNPHKPAAKKKDQINSTHKENFRSRLMRNQLVYERAYKKRLAPILRDQRKEALDNLEAHASSLTKAAQQKLFDDGAADQKMVSKLKPVLLTLGEEQGALAMAFAGDENGEFRMTAPYEKYIAESTLRMASRFNDETLERLNKTLAEGIQAGEALGDLKARVEDVYTYTSGSRSERVARTETLKASNTATEEAYRQVGYVTEKQWLVNPDACPECESFDGKVVGLEEDFIKQGESYTFTGTDGEEQSKTVDYEDVGVPPLHPNCRCTIVPVRE